MIDTIICGNTLDVLRTMESESIDCCITSPPYWGLRDYGIKGQLGLEPTFQLYIEHLIEIFDEVHRVLKKTGTCWVDMGDSYGGVGGQNVGHHHVSDKRAAVYGDKHSRTLKQNIMDKSLCNIPHRFAIAMTDSGKWIERNCIIWHKPSCMPSSAKDRFTVDFEYVFFFVKQKKYYFEQLFEVQSPNNFIAHGKNGITAPSVKAKLYPNDIKAGKTAQAMRASREWQNILPNGRNKRTVWCINPQPFKDAHFAVFPEKLVEPMIQAGCPLEICDKCSVAFNTEIKRNYSDFVQWNSKYQNNTQIKTGIIREGPRGYIEHTPTKEIKKCNCNAPTHAGTVLDPFVGSGTTALVAHRLGRHYIGIDLNLDYCKMAEKRLAEVL